jgi:hypothetical protein
MNKLYFIFIVLVLVASGAWFMMKKTSPVQSGIPVGMPTSTQGNTQQNNGPAATENPQQIAATNQITLSVTSPLNNATVTSPALTVRGKTAPNAEVFVNDAETKADAGGNFFASITLDEGENPVVIVANDANGNSAEQDIMVTYTAN